MRRVGSRLTRRSYRAWVFVVGGLFCADFFFYGYLPSQRRLQSLNESLAQQQEMIRTATAQARELPALKERLKKTEATLAHFEASAPKERAIGVFLQDVARMMTAYRLTDQAVEPGNDIEVDELHCIPIHIEGKGRLADIFAFFRDLQAMDRLVRIEKTTLKNSSDFGGQVTMETEGVIFYRPTGTQEAKPLAEGGTRGTKKNDA